MYLVNSDISEMSRTDSPKYLLERKQFNNRTINLFMRVERALERILVPTFNNDIGLQFFLKNACLYFFFQSML